MTQPLFSEKLGALFEAIDREPTGKLSELAKVANLSLAEDYIGVDLSGEDLSEDDLSGANFSNSNFSQTNLRGTNLNGANLMGANFMRANLSRANLIGADLSGANLIGANLSGANLNGANLNGVVIDAQTKLDAQWLEVNPMIPDIEALGDRRPATNWPALAWGGYASSMGSLTLLSLVRLYFPFFRRTFDNINRTQINTQLWESGSQIRLNSQN